MGKPTHAKSINSNQQKNLETKSGVSLICRKYSQQDNIIKIKKKSKEEGSVLCSNYSFNYSVI